MCKNLKELKEDYKSFIENISKNLERAKILLKIDVLTYSYEEVDRMMELYKTYYKKAQKISLTYEELAIIFETYIGETFMHYNNGNWEFCRVKNDDAYGTPVILNWGKDGFPHARISKYVWRILIERGEFKETISEKIRAAQIPMNLK